MKKKLLLFVFILLSLSNYATHIMGGDIAYEYMGQQTNGNYRYRITITVFGDAISNWPQPMQSIRFGVYMESSNPNDDKIFLDEYEVFLNSSSSLTPQFPPGCSINTNISAWEAQYSTIIDLPVSINGVFSNGYHILYDVCCRNNTIVNLQAPGGTGNSFYAFIPNPLIVNSSPIFSDAPVPFICANDTTPLLNTAFDPDGDLLIFSFSEPYRGYASTSNPQPIYSTDINPMAWAIPEVTWASGFSMNEPFGTNGYSFINSFTGYSEYMSPLQGPFVVAVEIKEYRNGNLIGITRRDMQFQVVACQANPAPNLTNTNAVGDTIGSGTTNFTIEEGDTLCFEIAFTDPNNDNLTLTSNGDIFDFSTTTPTASINTPTTGTPTVETTFCWETGCNQGRNQPYLFTVNAKDDGCAPKTDARVYSIQINEFEGPTSIFGPTNTCSNAIGNIYSVPNDPTINYSWTVAGGTIISGQNTNSINVNWGNAGLGEITLEVTSKNGCNTSPISLLVNINDVIINAGLDTSLCSGDTVMIGGNPTVPTGFSTSWSPISGINNTTDSNPLVSPSSTTEYILTADNSNGCVLLDTVLITVFELPTSVSNDTLICNSDTIQLFANGGDSYLWSPANFINNTTSNTPLIFPDTTTNFIVTISALSGCTTTDTVNVIVSNSSNSNSPDLWLCPSDSIQLEAPLNGTAYNWLVTDSMDNSTIYNPTIWASDTTQYIVEITDTIGCKSYDTTMVFVNTVVPTFAGNDTSICENNSVIIGGNPSAPLGTTFSWNTLTGLNDSTAANPIATPTNTTTYILFTTNQICNGTDTVTVIVFPPPIISSSNDTSICIGDSTLLIASGGATYNWAPSNLVTDSINDSTYVTPLTNTLYFVTVTDGNGCFSIDSISVNINQLPIVNAGSDVAICWGDSTLLVATGGTNYNWNPATNLTSPTNDSTIAFPTNSTEYIATVVDNNNCVNTDTIRVTVNSLPLIDAGSNTAICTGDSTLLTASGGNSYTWTPINNLTTPNNNSTTAFPTNTTTYFVLGVDTNGCQNTDSVVVTINSLPTIFAGNDVAICIGDSTILTATGGTSYTWTPANSLSQPFDSSTVAFPITSTTYIVFSSDNNSCSNSDTVTVSVNLLPIIDAGNDTSICNGGTIILGGNPTAPALSNYNWTPINSNASNPSVSPTQTTTYTVQVTDNNGCVNSDSIQVDVFFFSGLNDTTICQKEALTLTVNAQSGANPYAYNWYPPTNLSNANSASVIATPTEDINYFITVTDANNCIETDSIFINVNATPISKYEYTSTPNCDGVFADFTNLSINANASTWYLNGEKVETTNPTFTFPFGENLEIILVTTSTENCVDSSYVSEPIADITPPSEFTPPSIFTPNNDGINDLFQLNDALKYSSCTVINIYNRWGNLLFSSTSSPFWDGKTFAGKDVPSGTYFYIIEINEIIYKGSVTLLR